VSRPVIDVRPLPSFAFGHRGVIWWATFGIVAIEGTMFALMITNYLYLKGRETHWPPSVFPPALFWGTVNTIVMVASLVPAALTKMAAEKYELRKVRLWLGISIVFAVAFNIIRIFEFGALNVWWDQNAYGSVVWTLLGFHTVHTFTDLLDSIVLEVLLFTGPLEGKRFVDVSENSMYWYFVVLAWLPIYALIYFAPRVA
jgi:heme/copper-type cytochrome/quinol oxidase subunit 3